MDYIETSVSQGTFVASLGVEYFARYLRSKT
jgi:hypothetical protein